MLASLSALAAPLGLVAGVGVIAEPPDTLCPGRAEVAGALAERVPDEVVGWYAWYRVDPGEVATTSHVRFELHDNRGHVRLQRELFVGGGGCAAAADGLAMIVERYFEDVAWTAAVPLPELERLPEPEPDVRATRRPLELQAGLAARRELSLVPALALDVHVALARGWWAGAGLVLPTAGPTAAVGPVMAHLDSLPLRVSARWRVVRRALAFDFGPALTVVGQRLTGTPAFVGGSAHRLVVAAGGVASGRWWLTPAWAVGIEVGADLTLLAPAFVVDRATEVMAPARVSFLGLVGIARAFSR